MINNIHLKNFKCFETLNLPLSSLTLLSGGNASGKSSILQALVLINQTMREHEWSNRLMLNGSSLKMGTVTDVVDKVNGRFDFTIGLNADDFIYKWRFEGQRSDMSMIVQYINISDIIYPATGQLRYLLPHESDGFPLLIAERLRRMTYITAERIGPREFYRLDDIQTAPVVGPNGEFTVSLLHQIRDNSIISALILPGVPPTALRQAEARMQQFFPDCSLTLEQVPNQNAVTLGLRNSSATSFHRPIHVGFGLTQVLPIIVAVLAAKEGDLILIENPEVHLHPAGQAQMGGFLAEAVHAGIQIIVETHSDHVLNGIRRAVRSQKIHADDVALHFFRPRSADVAQVISPRIDPSGNIDIWPDGFFDQFDKDVNHFAGWGE